VLKAKLSSLTGFKKYAAAFVLGALMTLSAPPAGAFFVLLLCVPGFVWLARSSATKKEAFFIGWAFGAGYFIFGLYWISRALFVDIQQFWWVLPLSAIIGPAIIALYYSLIPLLAWRYRKNEAAYALMIVLAWSAIEWVRGHAFTGFPWNLPGYSWQYVLPVMQANAAIGIYGLTLLTLLWAAIPAVGRKLATALVLLFLVVLSAGWARLALYPTAQLGDNTVRIVQPNIEESLKWSRADMQINFMSLLGLSSKPDTLKQPLTFVVWPETATMPNQQPSRLTDPLYGPNLPKGATSLIGALRVDQDKHEVYNSVTVVDPKLNIVTQYNKHHLVPFGEYMPLRSLLNMSPIGNKVADIIGDFTRGDGVQTLNVGNNLPRPSPLICYEAIFPGEVADEKDRPDWLVNVTNDSWYGKTTGPHQHFESARVRAIEEGLPLVRVANTGISATVDPVGRIIGELPLGKQDVLDTILPAKLPRTLYARFGDTLFFLMLVLLGILGETLLKLPHDKSVRKVADR
jgi:apolipoprotein N-acyltransferase